MKEFLQDPMFFYTIAFVIFVALAWRYGRKPALQALDAEILKISSELERARQLRAEAEATLAEYRTKHAAALTEAETIVKHAKEEAVRLKAQAEIDLKNALQRHEQQAIERIRVAEAAALAEVRANIAALAIEIARESLAVEVKGGGAVKILDQAIAALPGEPAKAA